MKAPTGDRVRIDKWLWAARLYKTRSLASGAVSGGRVHLNGERVKAAHAVRVGDRIQVTRDRDEMTLEVLALAQRRGPASEAARLYQESEQSRKKRELEQERRRVARASLNAPPGRPDKKARRQIVRLRRESPDGHGD